eukprot:scaffold654_cov207-Ochromonas_danica.AAC.40
MNHNNYNKAVLMKGSIEECDWLESATLTIQQLMHPDNVQQHHNNNTPISSRPVSLFEQVMLNAQKAQKSQQSNTISPLPPQQRQHSKSKYFGRDDSNSSISSTSSGPTKGPKSTHSSSSSSSSTSAGFRYLQQMRLEESRLKTAVQAVIEHRLSADSQDDGPDVVDLDFPLPGEPKRLCPICERKFPQSQLPGRISWSTVQRWKEEHGVNIKEIEQNMTIMLEKENLKKEIGVNKLVKGPLNRPNQYYRQQMKSITAQALAPIERPESRMIHNMAVTELRSRYTQRISSLSQATTTMISNRYIDIDAVQSLLATIDRKKVFNKKGPSDLITIERRYFPVVRLSHCRSSSTKKTSSISRRKSPSINRKAAVNNYLTMPVVDDLERRKVQELRDSHPSSTTFLTNHMNTPLKQRKARSLSRSVSKSRSKSIVKKPKFASYSPPRRHQRRGRIDQLSQPRVIFKREKSIPPRQQQPTITITATVERERRNKRSAASIEKKKVTFATNTTTTNKNKNNTKPSDIKKVSSSQQQSVGGKITATTTTTTSSTSSGSGSGKTASTSISSNDETTTTSKRKPLLFALVKKDHEKKISSSISQPIVVVLDSLISISKEEEELIEDHNTNNNNNNNKRNEGKLEVQVQQDRLDDNIVDTIKTTTIKSHDVNEFIPTCTVNTLNSSTIEEREVSQPSTIVRGKNKFKLLRNLRKSRESVGNKTTNENMSVAVVTAIEEYSPVDIQLSSHDQEAILDANKTDLLPLIKQQEQDGAEGSKIESYEPKAQDEFPAVEITSDVLIVGMDAKERESKSTGSHAINTYTIDYSGDYIDDFEDEEVDSVLAQSDNRKLSSRSSLSRRRSSRTLTEETIQTPRMKLLSRGSNMNTNTNTQSGVIDLESSMNGRRSPSKGQRGRNISSRSSGHCVECCTMSLYHQNRLCPTTRQRIAREMTEVTKLTQGRTRRVREGEREKEK